MKILFLTHHWHNNSHHAKHSGYQQIVNEASKYHECSVVTWGHKNEVYYENGVSVYCVKPFIKRDIFFSKRLAISKFAFSIEYKFDVVHALYTDCAYYQKHKNLISTLHVSPYLEVNKKSLSTAFLFLKHNLIEKHVFKNSRKLIIVAKNLVTGIESYKNKIHFIPHGINTEYWSPERFHTNPPTKDYVLSVGNNGVDKEILIRAIKDNPDINFIFVGLRNFECNLNNLIQKSGISDDELKELYYNCSFFIRPMIFATANNSILEAMSMGKPVLISTPSGQYDYFDDESPYIKVVKNMNFSSEISNFINVINNFSLDDSIDIRSYTIAKFCWSNIFAQTYDLYQSKI
jgi:glycosyltransferase involved in cell wall biosynthesis